MSTATLPTVDLLILGAGWTSKFLIPLCESKNVSYAATTRHQDASTNLNLLFFEFVPESEDLAPYQILPNAKTVLITFPITLKGATERLVRLYQATHPGLKGSTGFVQLGSTGIWDTFVRQSGAIWADRHSPVDTSDDRANAETELLALSPSTPTTVLDLCGLWGGGRSIKHAVGRVLPTKEAIRNKGSIHMIHGIDVSRAILAVHNNFSPAVGQRWLLTDQRVYDWWDLAAAWGETTSREKSEVQEGRGPQPRWVRELMQEEGVRALPRSVERIGRGLDSREFWTTFGLEPIKGRLEDGE